MSTNLISSGTTAREKVNSRTPDVMAAVQEQVESHYRSDIVEKIRRAGGIILVGDTTVRLAKQFGFCYGVERAIDLAYAARKVFKDRRLFIVGEIIHNPEVNHQIASLGIKNLTGKNKQADIADLGPEDVVIVPAFGTELSIQQQIKDRGCQIVDTTCGDVMSVWKRVRKYASESATSIIHGKAEHELAENNFRFFDTICGATQERQDALRELLNIPMDLLLVVGGYNSSNTSHLAEMGEEKLPTYFVLNASRLVSATEIKHYDLHEKREVVSHFWLPNGPAVIGITAGAPCPNNFIEETLIRLFELRGIARRQLELAA